MGRPCSTYGTIQKLTKLHNAELHAFYSSPIFNLGARRGGDVHFLIARLYINKPGLNSKPFRVCILRRHIVLLIAIRSSDGDVKPGSPLGAFREEQAMSRHRVSPSPFHSSSSHTTQTRSRQDYYNNKK